MKVDFVVMAHAKREPYFDYLREHLGDDVKFSIDDDVQKLGTWGNARRAWSMVDRTADYGVVIQDDAILCEGFKEKAVEFIAKHEGYAMNLFYGNRGSSNKIWRDSTTRDEGYVEHIRLMWGVAIALPVYHIDTLIASGDRQLGLPDDTRIKNYWATTGLKARFPDPCLVDHRYGESLVEGTKDRDRGALNFIDKVHIPKIFHQIWVGDKPYPKEWIDTWRNVTGWEHRLWTEKEIEALDIINRDKYDWYKANRIWHGMADIARLEILYKYGGVYIDADTQRLKPWKDWRWLHMDFFAVRGNTAPRNNYRVTNGIMGCMPESEIVGEYISRVFKAEQFMPAWDTIGGTLLTKILQENMSNPNIAILEPYWFYPQNSRGIRTRGHDKAIARHFWGSTRRKGTGTYGG